MGAQPIRFEDGAVYERGMAPWSQLVGREVLAWLAPAPGLAWVDVGCGNGAFTELIVAAGAGEVQGIDPSAGQIAFARSRPGAAAARFEVGDAMALPFPAASFDVAVMALVIFFVPDAHRGVAEMVRVARPGGRVAAYAWDFAGGGFPIETVWAQLRADGMTPSLPPHPEVARSEALHELWTGCGLEDVAQRAITVERRFDDFETFWASSTAIGPMLATLGDRSAADISAFKTKVRARLPPADPDGRLVVTARANAIVGRVPSS